MTPPSDESRLEWALASYLEAFDQGKSPDREALLARYPEIREELRSALGDYDLLHRLAEPWRQLASIGPLAQPVKVGEYDLLELIDGGGQGLVYRARQASLERMVALKMILAGRLATEEQLQRFRLEARAAAAMSHPNIVPIISFGEHDGAAYFTMKFIEGKTLARCDRDWKSDPREAVRLVAVVARAIAHAHEQKIIHRDLKPGNILIDRAGTPWVTDFGLAKLFVPGEATDPERLFGTLPYMSPEQFSEKEERLTLAVDIWGLGAILYELLTGKVPFEGKDQDDTIHRIRHGDPASMIAINLNVPRELEEICLRCLKKNPEERYPSALSLAEDLERWLTLEATRFERVSAEGRRREFREDLVYLSNSVADQVLMKFKDWSLAVLQGATDPHLPELLRRKDRPACQGFLEGVRETFDDPARGLVRRGERPPFSSWFLIDESGVLIACTPDRVLIGQDMSGREWYQGAVAHTGKRWLDSVHVSRVFFSVVTENLSKSALSVPVYKGNEPDSPMIGVLGVSFTTSPDLGLSRLHDERHKVLVAGRWDPQSYGGYSPEDDHLVLVHPAYRRGEEAVKVSAPSLRNFRPSPESGELRPPEPGQVPVVDEEFKDPLAEGPRWAGIAPVGNTPFLAILEQRPDPLIEREAPIVVGQMVDLTGVTSYVSEPYAKGAQAYVDWLNAQGGINRKKVRLVRIDYRYQHVEALEIYERLKTVHQVLAIQGWGTGDSQMLTARVTQDRIPFLSASSSAQLTDPRKTPYNFILTADYSSQLRAALRFLRESWKRPRKPRLAFIYPDHPYGKSPIPAGMDYARELGFDVVGEQIVNLEATEATAEIRYFKNREPDFTWIGGTTPSTALILKEARKQDLQTRFFVNLWGNDESLIQRAGLAAEGVLGLQPSVLFGDDVPGMRALREAMRGEPGVTHGVRGWVSMMVLCEALRRADASGELTGPGIKRALETLCEFDPQGLLPSVTYTPNDHRPSTAVRIYEFSGGRMCHRAVVEAERRMEWLGV